MYREINQYVIFFNNAISIHNKSMEDETRKSNLRGSYLKKMINIKFEFNKFKIRKIEFIPGVDSEL